MKEQKQMRICDWRYSSIFMTIMIRSIWRMYISQETVHRGSYQAARFWKKVNLCWINFIFGNTSVQRQVI